MLLKSRIPACVVLCLTALAGCQSGESSLVSRAERAPWKTPERTGLRLTTEHYDIYTTTTDRWMQSYFPGFMEAAYSNYLSLTGLADRRPPKRMPIYMMGSREEWVDLTRHHLKERAEPYLAIQAGGYCHRGVCVFWHLKGPNALAVAAHEGLHQFLHYRLRDHLPMWLEEGICTVTEGYHVEGQAVRFTPERNLSRFTDLRSAIANGRWIPLKRLLYMDASDALSDKDQNPLVYYGQVWALARFLKSSEPHAPRLHKMLADAEAGKFHEALNMPHNSLAQLQLRGRAYNQTVSEPLFRHYISDDLAGFERSYRAFATRIAELR